MWPFRDVVEEEGGREGDVVTAGCWGKGQGYTVWLLHISHSEFGFGFLDATNLELGAGFHGRDGGYMCIYIYTCYELDEEDI